MNNPLSQNTVRRNNGNRFATINDDGSRVFLIMYQPEGYSGQTACWLPTIDETERLIAALQERVAKLKAKQAALGA